MLFSGLGYFTICLIEFCLKKVKFVSVEMEVLRCLVIKYDRITWIPHSYDTKLVEKCVRVRARKELFCSRRNNT